VSDRSSVFETAINNFHYLYSDASLLLEQASAAVDFQRVQYSRTAILIFILSLEALINRVLAGFLTEPVRSFVMEQESRFALEEKWKLVPRLVDKASGGFDESAYPWSHFRELIRLRNDFVHPKHDRRAYYEVSSDEGKFNPLQWTDVPRSLGLIEADLVYRQNRIPKDPYSILPEHAAQAKKVVDDMVCELDRILGGEIMAGDWLNKDVFRAIIQSPDDLEGTNRD
jgi:hypothetical protein